MLQMPIPALFLLDEAHVSSCHLLYIVDRQHGIYRFRIFGRFTDLISC